MTPTPEAVAALAAALHLTVNHWYGLCPAIDDDRATRILAALPAGWALVDMEAWRECLRDASLEMHTMGLDASHGETFAGCDYPVCAEARRLLGLEDTP